jgi:TolA-binding protein
MQSHPSSEVKKATLSIPDVPEYQDSSSLRLAPDAEGLLQSNGSDTDIDKRHVQESDFFRLQETVSQLNNFLTRQNELLMAFTEMNSCKQIATEKQSSSISSLYSHSDSANINAAAAPASSTSGVVLTTPIGAADLDALAYPCLSNQDSPRTPNSASLVKSSKRQPFDMKDHHQFNLSSIASSKDKTGFYSGSRHCGRRIDAIW